MAYRKVCLVHKQMTPSEILEDRLVAVEGDCMALLLDLAPHRRNVLSVDAFWHTWWPVDLVCAEIVGPVLVRGHNSVALQVNEGIEQVVGCIWRGSLLHAGLLQN